ncbi:MAG: mhpE [Chloroflexi bacterium]|jgi:4-hydroxy-2-oxovalerate aldolase|nr:mhpE [Chloroflexota bacterium]
MSANASKGKIFLTDMTCRDGMHPMQHSLTPAQMARIVGGLAEAGVPTIEVSHGDGLGGSSFNYGFGAASDREYLEAVAPVLKNSELSVLLLPGIGTKPDLEMAVEYGAKVARIATHVTEADIAEQHINLSKKLGMRTVGFLMMSHMGSPEKIAEQGRLMESYGADVVYVTDSAGALIPDTVKARVSALRQAVSCAIGYHAHNNLGLAIGNSLAAIEEGATHIDGTLCGLGAGAGNAQTEILVAVLDKMGYETGVDLFKVMDQAEDVVKPLMLRPQLVDRAALTIGYAGVYSSFLLFANRAAEKYGVEARAILMELGRMGAVGGQEDLIVDVALQLAQAKQAQNPEPAGVR